jgi:hypothetical protein
LPLKFQPAPSRTKIRPNRLYHDAITALPDHIFRPEQAAPTGSPGNNPKQIPDSPYLVAEPSLFLYARLAARTFPDGKGWHYSTIYPGRVNQIV